MMNRLRRIAPAAIALSLLAGCAADAAGDAADEKKTLIGNLGAVDFTATPLSPLAEGTNSFEVELRQHGSSTALSGATVKVEAIMPAMGHGASVKPEVQEVEPGRYKVTDVVFSMPGTWEVRYSIDRAALHDAAAFRYEVR